MYTFFIITVKTLNWTISDGLCWNIDSRKRIWRPRAHFGSENESLNGLREGTKGMTKKNDRCTRKEMEMKRENQVERLV